ncbi:MAG TPA: DUF4388 domain-containing protein [Pyrinomonadaceae bacterium]
MQSTNFVVLTGHLNDYPLADLISILRHQRKTGRLLIEYGVGPCAFYFAEGELVDAQLNSLAGLQAIIVALSQPNAAFNFNPLIPPPRRSINESSQKVVLELLGCWEEKTIEVEGTATEIERAASSLPSQANLEVIETDDAALLPRAKETLALPPAPLTQASAPRIRQVVIMSAVVSLLVSLLTVIVLTSWFNKKATSSEVGSSSGTLRNQSALTEENAQTVKVVVRIEDGRVKQAFVAEHRAGAEAYEALALRIARGRRYPATASGEDTVLLKINSPK